MSVRRGGAPFLAIGDGRLHLATVYCRHKQALWSRSLVGIWHAPHVYRLVSVAGSLQLAVSPGAAAASGLGVQMILWSFCTYLWHSLLQTWWCGPVWPHNADWSHAHLGAMLPCVERTRKIRHQAYNILHMPVRGQHHFEVSKCKLESNQHYPTSVSLSPGGRHPPSKQHFATGTVGRYPELPGQ